MAVVGTVGCRFLIRVRGLNLTSIGAPASAPGTTPRCVPDPRGFFLDVTLEGVTEADGVTRAREVAGTFLENFILERSGDFETLKGPDEPKVSFQPDDPSLPRTVSAAPKIEVGSRIALKANVAGSDLPATTSAPPTNKNPRFHDTFSRFAAALGEEDPVIRFQEIYDALRGLVTSQSQLDGLFHAADPKVPFLPSKHPKAKSTATESIYSSLRNDSQHSSERKADQEKTKRAMAQWVQPLQRIAASILRDVR